MLFLALKNIRIVKITLPQVPTTCKKNSPGKISDSSPTGGDLTPPSNPSPLTTILKTLGLLQDLSLTCTLKILLFFG